MEIGDAVRCKVIEVNKKLKIVMKDYDKDHKVKIFEVVGLVPYGNEETGFYQYMILISEDYLGWGIGQFHIDQMDVDKKYLGKRFYEINESQII